MSCPRKVQANNVWLRPPGLEFAGMSAAQLPYCPLVVPDFALRIAPVRVVLAAMTAPHPPPPSALSHAVPRQCRQLQIIVVGQAFLPRIVAVAHARVTMVFMGITMHGLPRLPGRLDRKIGQRHSAPVDADLVMSLSMLPAVQVFAVNTVRAHGHAPEHVVPALSHLTRCRRGGCNCQPLASCQMGYCPEHCVSRRCCAREVSRHRGGQPSSTTALLAEYLGEACANLPSTNALPSNLRASVDALRTKMVERVNVRGPQIVYDGQMDLSMPVSTCFLTFCPLKALVACACKGYPGPPARGR